MNTQQAKEALLRKHKLERKEQRKVANELLTGKKGEERGAAEATIKQMQEEMSARHATELERFEKGEAIEKIVGEMESVSVSKNSVPIAAAALNGSKSMSKAQRRRERKKMEEAQRRKEIEDAKQGLGPTDRDMEIETLNSLLHPTGFQIREVKADGHCLYRALGDQLLQTGLGTGMFDGNEALFYKRIREVCADSIMERSELFAPFLELGQGEQPRDITEYCNRIRYTAEWGGQVELQALAHALQVPIVVYSASAPVVTIGEEYMNGLAGGEPLKVSYHKFYYALGEHYNSVERVSES